MRPRTRSKRPSHGRSRRGATMVFPIVRARGCKPSRAHRDRSFPAGSKGVPPDELYAPVHEVETPPEIEDDRLRLLFTCCHAALAGLVRQIARAFVEPEATTAQRLVRAKRKIRDARIPYEVPAASSLPERVDTVLSVLYLIFNEGYASTDAPSLLRPDLIQEAIRLARLTAELLPANPGSRRVARFDNTDRFPARRPRKRRRRTDPLGRAGPQPLGPAADTGLGTGAAGARPLPDSGRHRRTARGSGDTRSHRLDPDGGALPGAVWVDAQPCRRPECSGGAWPGAWYRRGADAHRRPRSRGRIGAVPSVARSQNRPITTPWPAPGGSGSIHAGAPTRDESDGTPLPRTAPRCCWRSRALSSGWKMNPELHGLVMLVHRSTTRSPSGVKGSVAERVRISSGVISSTYSTSSGCGVTGPSHWQEKTRPQTWERSSS